MQTTAPTIRLALVIGSVRAGRFAPTVATWVRERIAAHGGFDLDVIDLADLDLPAALDGSGDAAVLRSRVGRADAFVVLTPEYNHGYPGALKTAIDSVLEEWHRKPLGFVSYGGSAGGTRSVEQLRQVFAELQVVTARRAVVLPNVWDLFDADGRLVDPSRPQGALTEMLDELRWWADALVAARATAAAA